MSEYADGHERKCYMWLVRGGLEHPVHSYNFRWTRSGRNVIPFLEGFSGNVIQSDGYAGYDAAVAYWNENHPDHKIELCNCNIHARRKFADSVKATKYVWSRHAIAQGLDSAVYKVCNKPYIKDSRTGNTPLRKDFSCRKSTS